MEYANRIIRKMVLVFVLMVAVNFAGAATYYVSNSGNDSNNGLSEGSSWQTIAKINSVTFSPGDSILFKRGDVWTGSTINIRHAGTSSNRITMGAYGSGAKPIIDGGSGKSAILSSGERGYWTIDGLDLRTSGISAGGMGMALAIQHNYWPDGELGALPGWIIQDCNFNTGILISGPDTIIRNNVFEGSAQQTYNIAAIYLRGTRGDNVLIEGNTISNYRGHGMWIMRGCDNVVIRNNVVHNITLGTETNPAGPGHGIANDGYGIKNTNMKVYNNHVGNVVQIGINGENAFGAEYYNNYVHDCGWYGFDIFLYQSGDYPTTDHRGENTGNNFHHNVIHNCENGFLSYDGAGYTLANNVFYTQSGGNFGLEISGTGSTYSRNVTFVNNIVAGSWVHPIRTSGTYKTMFTTFDYNLMVPIGTELLYDGYDGSRNLSHLRALGMMTHGLISNPMFVNPSNGDFRLQEGSPAINAGILTAKTTDFDGEGLVGLQDIGAFEYQESPSLPTGSLTVNAGTGGTATGTASNFNVPDTRSISASAGAGYSFSGWTKTSGDCTVTSLSSSSTTAVVNSGDCILQANFQQLPRGNLTVNAGSGGTANGNALNFLVPDTRSISASAGEGYSFSGWTKTSGDCTIASVSAASTNVVVNSGICIIQANFQSLSRGNLTVTNNEGGTTSGSSSNFLLPSTFTISATSSAGYYLNNWTRLSGDCSISSPSSETTTVQINSGECFVQAFFNQITAKGNLTVSSTAGGNVSGSRTNFDLPSSSEIEASPQIGYRFVSWNILSGDCVAENLTDSQTSITISNGACYVRADFAQLLPPTINVYASSVDSTANSDVQCNYQVNGQNFVPVKIEINWIKNGIVILRDYSSTLPKSSLTVGDEWACQVNASDLYSARVTNSNIIVIGTTKVDNTHPTGSGGGSSGDVYIFNYYDNKSEGGQESFGEPQIPNLTQNVNEQTTIEEADINPVEDNPFIGSKDINSSEYPEDVKGNGLFLILLGVFAVALVGGITLLTRKKVESDWRVLQFIETSLKGGFRRESIHRALRTKKISPRVIKYHMKLTRDETLHVQPQSPDNKVYPPEIVQELQKYVASQKAHTFTNDEIREVLINKGYSNKIIDEVMATAK